MNIQSLLEQMRTRQSDQTGPDTPAPLPSFTPSGLTIGPMGGTTPASYVSNISGQVDGLKNALMSSAKNLGSIASGLSNPGGLGGMAITSNAIRPDSDFSLSELAPIVSAAAPEFAEGGAVNNLYKRPMFMQQGGAATPRLPTPMANMPMARAPSGAMPPMRPSSAPMAPAPRIPAAPSRPTAPDSQGIASMVADKAKADLATAQGPEQLINAFRGNQKPIAARYQELAEYVGPNDAGRTPTSVLTMVQPTIMMTEKGAADSGIGQLMAGMPEANAPMKGDMGAGIMRQAPVRMDQGGDPRMADFQNQQAFLQEALGLDPEALRRRARSRGIVQAGLQGLTRQPRLGESAAQQILPTIFEALGAGSEADMAVDQLMRQSVSTPAAQYALDQEQARKAAAAARQQKIFEKALETPEFEPGYLVDTQTLTPAPNQPVVNIKDPRAVRNANIRAEAEGTVLVPASQIKAISKDAMTPTAPEYKVLFDPSTGRRGGAFNVSDPAQKTAMDEAIMATGLIPIDPKDVPITEAPPVPEGRDDDLVAANAVITQGLQLPSGQKVPSSNVRALVQSLRNYTQPTVISRFDTETQDTVTDVRRNQLDSQTLRDVQTLVNDGKLDQTVYDEIFQFNTQVSPPRGEQPGAGQPGAGQPGPDESKTVQQEVVQDSTVNITGIEVPAEVFESPNVQENILREYDYSKVTGFGNLVSNKLGNTATAILSLFGEQTPVISTIAEFTSGGEEEKAIDASLNSLHQVISGASREVIGGADGRIAEAFRQEISELIPKPNSGVGYGRMLEQYRAIRNRTAEQLRTTSRLLQDGTMSQANSNKAKNNLAELSNVYTLVSAVIQGMERGLGASSNATPTTNIPIIREQLDQVSQPPI